MDTLVIGENYFNHETLGRLTIRKTGEVLANWKTEAGALDPWMTDEAEDGNFIYETRPLALSDYNMNMTTFHCIYRYMLLNSSICHSCF